VSSKVGSQKDFSHKLHSFQEVQHLSAVQAALRFLPNVVIGMVLNLATGLMAHRLHADRLVIITTFLSAGSPLLMAIIDPNWSWWYCAFWAVLLGPLSADGEFFIYHFRLLPPKSQPKV
jgi:hypothetical protein